MKHFLAVLALLLLGTVAYAEPLVTDSQGGVRYDPAELRLDYLPDDSNATYLTVYGTGPRYEQVVKWFDVNDELRRLKDSSHFTAIDTTSVMFRDRYAASTPGKLTIRLQAADGMTIHEVVDGQIPLSAEAFIRQTNTECFRRRNPNLQPPVIDDPPAQPVAPPKPKQRIPWLILGVLAAIGAAVGVVREWKSLYFNRK